MTPPNHPTSMAEAVLITGAFGVGKSTVLEEEMLAAGGAPASGDIVVSNDRAVQDVAGEILDRLGWLPA